MQDTNCEIIQKQQEYIKQLEAKINELTNKKVPMTWVSVRKIAENRMEQLGLNNQKQYSLWSGITSFTSKAMRKQTVTSLVGEDAEKANKIVTELLDMFEKYYREDESNEQTNV